MKEFINKLIERLEEERTRYRNYSEDCYNRGNRVQAQEDMVISIGIEKSIEIVNQLAEEYSNDWIPCSERLPEWGTTPYLVCLKHGGIFLALYLSSGQFKEISSMGIREFCENNPVIAWQPLPAPYQPKGE